MVEEITDNIKNLQINEINRGTGAGGANTTINGIKLEHKVKNTIDSKSLVLNVEKTKAKFKILNVEINKKEYKRTQQTGFRRWDLENNFSKSLDDYKNKSLHGAKAPDDCLINEKEKIINWVECKSQSKGGSKCEVLQTYNQKIRNLKERYPEYKINYIFVLDKLFRNNCSKEISYIIEDNINNME